MRVNIACRRGIGLPGTAASSPKPWAPSRCSAGRRVRLGERIDAAATQQSDQV